MDSGMKIDVAFSPLELEKKDVQEKAVVVIDALRATSTMIIALANGCSAFVPVARVEEARELVAASRNPHYVLGGERGGRMVEGFQFGNSPREYRPEEIKGKVVVMTTTNGTRALVAAQRSAIVFIGAFLNISALAERLLEVERDILIACAGEKDLFCLEDAVCAGAIIDRLGKMGYPLSKSDSALAAQLLYEHYEADIDGMLSDSAWGQYLETIGLGKDVRICGRINCYDLVPVYCDGKIFLDR
jgi:2-phosphosulfolactate phosphatase